MKRFLVFAGARWYPLGGWADFDSSHDDKDAAVARASELVPDNGKGNRWAEVIDTQDGEDAQAIHWITNE